MSGESPSFFNPLIFLNNGKIKSNQIVNEFVSEESNQQEARQAKYERFMASKCKISVEPDEFTMFPFDRSTDLHDKTTPNNSNCHFPYVVTKYIHQVQVKACSLKYLHEQQHFSQGSKITWPLQSQG